MDYPSDPHPRQKPSAVGALNHLRNCISVMQSVRKKGEKVLLLPEYCFHSVGFTVIYFHVKKLR